MEDYKQWRTWRITWLHVSIRLNLPKDIRLLIAQELLPPPPPPIWEFKSLTKKRFIVWLDEPDESDMLNVAAIRELTGNDTFFARSLTNQ